jgi:hypothetical protein
MASGKDRQQALRERRREAGIRQYVYWLTREQAEAVKRFIGRLAKRRAAK